MRSDVENGELNAVATGQNKHLLAGAFSQFFCHSPLRVSFIFLLMFTQGITAGIGLLFIVPLIEVLNILPGGNDDNRVVSFAREGLGNFGIPITLTSILIVYIVIVSLISGIQYLQTVESSKIQQSYIYRTRSQIYRALLRCDWQFMVNSTVPNFVHALTVQIQKTGVAMTVMVSILSQLSLTLVMFVLALLISWQSTLIAGLLLALLLCVLLPLNKRVYGSGMQQDVKFKSLFKMLAEQLSNLKIVKSFSAENYFVEQVEATGRILERQNVKLTTINAFTHWVYLFGATCSFAAFLHISQTYLYLTSEQILLFLVIVARMIPQVSGLQKSYQQLLHLLPAFKDIDDNYRCIQREQDKPINAAPLIVFNETLTLKNIEYRYSHAQNNALKNVNLTLHRNEIIALTGASGAGKSTLIDIMSGLLSPSEGTITCDGQLITEHNRTGWRQNIAYVTQDTLLFNDTIETNLAWVCNKKPSESDIWRALELAAAKNFVEALPRKLQTEVGDRGIRLSGGERQRLGIARAILSGRHILLLDEATSALDESNEITIQQTIKNLAGQMTIVIIAHRQSTLAIADRIIRIDDGYAEEQLAEKSRRQKFEVIGSFDCTPLTKF